MRNNTTRYLPLFFHLWNDLHIEVTPVPVSQLNKSGLAESSATIRERVLAARTEAITYRSLDRDSWGQ